jgi:hypothetical protein
MQQPVNNNNNKFQQQVCSSMYQLEDRLDMEIEEMRMLMVKMSQRRHAKVKNIYISRENGQLQETTMQQDNKASKQQHKVWDPGGLQQWNS